MNYNFEIQKVLLKLDQTSYFEDKIILLKQAIQIADANNDLDWGFDLRLDIIHWEGFLARSTESFPAFAWLLNVYDTQPDLFDEKEVLKRYKWMVHATFDYLSISADQLRKILEDYSSRLARNGFSQQSYYEIEVSWSLFIGDVQRARHYLDCRNKETFDNMCSDEAITDICVELLDRNIEKGITMAKELVSRKPEEKAPIYCMLVYYLNLAKDSRAEDYFKKVELLLSDVEKYPYMIFDISQLMYYLSKNNEKKAWQFLEQYSEWEIGANEYYSFDFSLSIMPLLLEDKEINLQLSSKLPFYKEEGCYSTRELYEYYSEKINVLGCKFDERNGNTYFREQIDKHINQ